VGKASATISQRANRPPSSWLLQSGQTQVADQFHQNPVICRQQNPRPNQTNPKKSVVCRARATQQLSPSCSAAIEISKNTAGVHSLRKFAYLGAPCTPDCDRHSTPLPVFLATHRRGGEACTLQTPHTSITHGQGIHVQASSMSRSTTCSQSKAYHPALNDPCN
jgi:hypothetical protein